MDLRVFPEHGNAIEEDPADKIGKPVFIEERCGLQDGHVLVWETDVDLPRHTMPFRPACLLALHSSVLRRI